MIEDKNNTLEDSSSVYPKRGEDALANKFKPKDSKENKKVYRFLISLTKKRVLALSGLMVFVVFAVFFLGFLSASLIINTGEATLGVSDGDGDSDGNSSAKAATKAEAASMTIDNLADSNNDINRPSAFQPQEIVFETKLVPQNFLSLEKSGGRTSAKQVAVKKSKPKVQPSLAVSSKEKTKKTSLASSGSKNSYLKTEKLNGVFVLRPEAGNVYFYIQVIAVSDIAKARGIVENLIKRNFKASFITAGRQGRDLYIIRVGLYKARVIAERHLKRFHQIYPDAFLRLFKKV